MTWICGALSFLWFCPSANLMSAPDFEGHLKFFRDLDIALSVPDEVCPEIGDSLMEFKATGHLVYDQRLEAEIGSQKIDQAAFALKVKTCARDCTCGALLSLEDKVEPKTTSAQSETLNERLELLTNDYYLSCQKKIKLSCESDLVKEILKRSEL